MEVRMYMIAMIVTEGGRDGARERERERALKKAETFINKRSC